MREGRDRPRADLTAADGGLAANGRGSPIARSANSIGPLLLKALDAIHLATAQALGPELDAFVTYDDRLAEAARTLGLPVVRPA